MKLIEKIVKKKTDPVCMMKIDDDSTAIKSIFKEKTYFFCTNGCRKKFESNPQQYIGREPTSEKGIWGRYLDRLEKTTNGKPMKCC